MIHNLIIKTDGSYEIEETKIFLAKLDDDKKRKKEDRLYRYLNDEEASIRYLFHKYGEGQKGIELYQTIARPIWRKQQGHVREKLCRNKNGRICKGHCERLVDGVFVPCENISNRPNDQRCRDSEGKKCRGSCVKVIDGILGQCESIHLRDKTCRGSRLSLDSHLEDGGEVKDPSVSIEDYAVAELLVNDFLKHLANTEPKLHALAEALFAGNSIKQCTKNKLANPTAADIAHTYREREKLRKIAIEYDSNWRGYWIKLCHEKSTMKKDRQHKRQLEDEKTR
jgi:hypothetical protein